MTNSALVHEMNRHLGAALKLIEEGSANNNAQIREEMKRFFSLAEQIEKAIAENEVSSLNTVKRRELDAVREQSARVTEYLEQFDEQIRQIEERIRGALEVTVPLLDMSPTARFD